MFLAGGVVILVSGHGFPVLVTWLDTPHFLGMMVEIGEASKSLGNVWKSEVVGEIGNFSYKTLTPTHLFF